MLKPVENASVWRGDQLFQRDDWLTIVDANIGDQIDRALEATHQLPVDQISADNFSVPGLTGLLAAKQRSLEEGCGLALIRGLPIERYDDHQTERLLVGLASHLGTPVSQNIEGRLVFPVRDERLGDSDPRARGPSSRKGLSFHTDRCDVIGFLCVRQAKAGGENYVVSSPALYNEMLLRRPDLVTPLTQPYRYQRHNVDSGNELPYYEQPVFSWQQGHFAASLLRVLIERAYAAEGAPSMTEVQREALDFLEQLADDPTFHASFRQQPGDLVLMNNWVTMHRRSEFVDHEPLDRRRLLWRVWLSVPNSRPIDPRFAASYGATTAGAIRGGMKPI